MPKSRRQAATTALIGFQPARKRSRWSADAVLGHREVEPAQCVDRAEALLQGDLVDLMVDRVCGEYRLPDRPSGDWRAGLIELAHQGRDMMRRHPWLPGAVLSHNFLGPNALRYMEHCLATLEGSGLDDGLKMELISMVNGTVISMVSSEQAVAERAKESGHSPEQRRVAQTGYLQQVVGAGRYPLVARVLANSAPANDPDEVFTRRIERVLDAYRP